MVYLTACSARFFRRHSFREVVFTSSAAIYGEPEYIPIDVNHPTRPKSPYGLSKLYEEQLLRQFSEEYGYSLAVLRLFNVYGENQEKSCSVH